MAAQYTNGAFHFFADEKLLNDVNCGTVSPPEGAVNGTTNGNASKAADGVTGGVVNESQKINIETGGRKAISIDIPRLEPSADIKMIMVTGGNGFIGHWILRAMGALYSDCYHFISFDSLAPGMTAQNTESLKALPNVDFFDGDITSPADVESCIRQHQVDTIIHLAAVSSVTGSSDNPVGVANSNVDGTLILLDRASGLGVRRFIFMSSAMAYGQAEAPASGFPEGSPLRPTNLYGGSKAAAEMFVTAVGQSTKLKTMIIRAANIYGPNQFPDKVIPKFILLLNRGLKVPLNGTEKHTRRYLYATDTVHAFNTVLHRGEAGAVYNLGADREISNRDLCACLVDVVRPAGSTGAEVDAWIEAAPEKPLGDKGASMDCARLTALGWRPLVSMEQGLRETVNWYTGYGESWWGDIEHVILPAGSWSGK